MTDRQLSDVLDQCLTLMTEERISVEACLARYPQHAGELRPLLEIAVEMRRIPRPEARQAAVDAGKQRMLEAVREREAARQEAEGERNRVGLLTRWDAWVDKLFAGFRLPAPAWTTAAAAAVVLLILAVGGGLVLPAWLGTTVERTARLDALEGRVEVLPAGGSAWASASTRERLEAGDRVRTAEQSVGLLTFFDGSTTALEAGTELTLLELSSRRDGTGKVIVLHQIRGQTRHDVQPLRRAEARFQVRTPTALAVVRGTTFDISVEPDGTTNVGLWSGMVEVTWLTEPAADGATVALQPGWFTVVKPDRPPSQPVVVPTPLANERFAKLPTAQPTDTPSPTATATDTPLPTATATWTPSPLPTETPEPTVPSGRTRRHDRDESMETPVPPTATPVPSDTPAPTATPTHTPLPSPTPTATEDQGPPPPEPTDTPSPTPRETATADGPPPPELTDTPAPTSEGPPAPEPTEASQSTPSGDS